MTMEIAGYFGKMQLHLLGAVKRSQPMPRKPERKKVEIFCAYCGESHFIDRHRPSQPNRGKYCSLTCARKAQHQNQSQTGENNPHWCGGKTTGTKGYIFRYMPEHPYSYNGYILEHRAVMEETLGRILDPE
jgi:hypothetical protein